MSWYTGPFTDPESGLVYVSNTTPDHHKTNPIICVSQLSRPYLIAPDDVYPNKIWILNYK